MGAFGWVKRMFGGEPLEMRQFAPETSGVPVDWAKRQQPIALPHDGERYTLRDGKSVRVGPVMDAWVSNDLPAMLTVRNAPAHPVDRHHLLCGIVARTYQRRQEPTMATLCIQAAEEYLAALPAMLPALRHEWGAPIGPIDVFRQYATLLGERGQFDRAIEVCHLAFAHGLKDGTKGGFEGRIARVRRAQGKALANRSTDSRRR